jgi:hypothetical protein
MKKIDLILDGTEFHPGRMKLINTWVEASRAKDGEAAAIFADILLTLDDMRGIERTRQLMFSGAAFTAGFLVAVAAYLN